MPIHPTRRRRVGAIAVLACMATLLVVDPFMVSRARAAPGDGHALLGAATADKAAALPGDTIQYSFTYSCQNSIGGGTPDGCDGAAFADPIPLFTDVYGVTTPLTFVSASGPAAQWPSGFALDSSDPAHPVVRGTAGNWAPGTSGSIFVTVTVPPNMVPMVTQAVTNTAVVTDPQAGPDSSTTASVNLSATARVWTLAQSTDPSTRLNHPVVWNLTMCAAITAAMFPWVRLTEQLPPGATFKSADAGGTYTDDSGGAPDLTSDGAGQVVWTFDATHRPPLDGGGCLSLQVVGTFTAGYTKPGGTNPANDNNVGGAVKTAVFSGVGRDTPGGASTPFNTPTGTTTIAAPVFGWGGGGVDKNIVRDADNASIYYTTRGMAVRFELMATLDSDLAADSFTVTDGSWTYVNGGSSTSGYGMPPYFAPASVVPGVWNHPLTATISGSNDNFVSYVADSLPPAAPAGALLQFNATVRNDGWNVLSATTHGLVVSATSLQRLAAARGLARAEWAAAGLVALDAAEGVTQAARRRLARAGFLGRGARESLAGAVAGVFPLPADLAVGGSVVVHATVQLPALAAGDDVGAIVDVVYQLAELDAVGGVAKTFDSFGNIAWSASVVVATP